MIWESAQNPADLPEDIFFPDNTMRTGSVVSYPVFQAVRYCPVHILYHGVNDTLRLYDNLDLIHRYIKQPLCFDHFQSFVDHRGRVDCDLASHLPIRMLQGIFYLDMKKLFPLFPSKWSAGRCEQDLMQRLVLSSLQD